MDEEEPPRNIEDLEIYIPFIDYLVSLDSERYKKMGLIKQWILEKKRYPSDVVRTMELSIFTQYKNQYSEDLKMPKEFLTLFNRTGGVRYSTINLCSDDDESDDKNDIGCNSSTKELESNKSKKKNTENLSNVNKEEEPCTSSSIALGERGMNKQGTVQSVHNDKDEIVCVSSSSDVLKNIEIAVFNISSNISEGEIEDSDNENVIQSSKKPSTEIVISDEDDKIVSKIASNIVEKTTQLENKNSFPERAETIKNKTDEIRENKMEAIKRKKRRRKRKNIVQSKSPVLITTNENKVSSTSKAVVADDDNAAFFERIEKKVWNLSDKSSDNSDVESFYDNFDDVQYSASVNNDNKPKDILTDAEIKKEELFTRRPKKNETICTVDSQNDELGKNVTIDPEIFVISETEDMEIDPKDIVVNKRKTINSDDKTDIGKKVEGVAKLENNLEKMDISELDSILKKLESSNNFDLEQILFQLLAQTGNNNNTVLQSNIPTESRSVNYRYPHDNSSVVPPAFSQIFSPKDINCSPKESFISPLPNCLPQKSFISPPPNCVTEKSFIPPPPRSLPMGNISPPAMSSSKFQTENASIQQFSIAQPIHYQHVPPSTPTFFNNGRKLNLNDPRIMRQLQILQNSPITNSNIREMATNLTNFTRTVQSQQQPHKKPAAPKAIHTYGEYKRFQAERKMEAERRKEEAARLKEAEQRKEAERVAEVKRAAQRFAEEKRAAERLAEEKRVAERLAEEKRAAELLAEEKRVAERLAEEKRVAERLAEEKRVAERLAEEKRVAERLAEEKRAAKETNEIRQILRDNPKNSIESIINTQPQAKPPTKRDVMLLNRNPQPKQIKLHIKNNKTDSSMSTAVAPNKDVKSNATKVPKKVGRPRGPCKSFYNLVPKPSTATAASSTKGEKNSSASSKLSKKKLGRKPDTCKTTRVLKTLECTFIGFNEFKDYIPTSLNGKRLSSECARNAIFKQLSSSHGDAAQFDDSTDDDLNTKRSVHNTYIHNNEPPQRRSSFNAELKEPSFTAAIIRRRRKTCVEFDDPSFRPASILSRRKTCTASLSLARSSSPIDDDFIYVSDSSEPILENMHQEMTIVNITSDQSSDTDTFDLTEFKREKERKDEEKQKLEKQKLEKEKLEKQKTLMIKNQPIVRLFQYTPKQIETLLNHAKSEANDSLPGKEEFLKVQLVQASSEKTMQPESSIKKPPKLSKQVKNTLCAMTERNTRYCVLCKSKPSDLVNHYVRSHKCEPYVARLTEDELEDLQINWPSAIPCAANAENPRFLKYKVKCLFCEDELIDSFINFYNHFSTHTGEYGFQCENCKLQKPFRADIQSHKHHSKLCRNARIQTIYVYLPNLMAIYLHCCKLCNFVQLNEANVHKHLREHHNQFTSNNSNLVQKYIAAAINDAEIVNEASQESELLDDEEMEETAKVSNIPECKQEFILEEEAGLSAEKKNHPSGIAMTNATAVPMTIIHKSNNIDDTIATTEEIPRPIIVKTEPVLLEIKKEIEVSETISLSHTLQSQMNKRNQPHLWYRLYSPDTPYFGLLKCMANDCLYSTNEPDEMLTHLNDHSTSECPPIGYLDCSYCKLQRNQCTTSEALIAHVLERHYYSCYQCPKCCYRSCIPGNAIIHHRSAHLNDDEDAERDEFVYLCDGLRITANDRLVDMMHSMEQNVRKLPCKYCDKGFYAVSNLAKHLVDRHNAIEDNFEEYVCIYCGSNGADKKEMQSHLALKHPDELAYTCLRTLKDAQKEDVVSNLILCDIKEDILSTNIRNTNVIVNNLSTAANFNFRIDGGEEAVHEFVEEPQDLKPSFAQLEQIAVDSLGSRLNKLTCKTGLPPDILYQCAETTCGGFFSNHELWSRHMRLRHNCSLVSCPHCPNKEKLPVSDFLQHFEEHCRHLYVCFYCGVTFVNKEGVLGHFQLVHSTESATDTRFETVRFNIRYSYHILISAQLYPERLEFLEALRVNVIKRLDQLATEEKLKLLNKWIVPLTADWLDNYPVYLHSRHCLKRCLDKSCTYKSTCDNELASHLRSTHVINCMRFQCSKCSFYISQCDNWDQILDHFAMHKSNIYGCCVCGFYHFKRENLMTHIKNEHNSRDVPFISLDRSVEGTHVSAGVVFAAGRKILTTSRTCFFCTSAEAVSETYIKHLKKIHNVYLKYHCEICLASFERLVDVDEHFKNAHIGIQTKISCEFISDGQVEVCNIRPLQLNVVNANAPTTVKRGFDNDDSNLYSDNKRLKVSCPPISNIKKELLDADDNDGNNTDSSVEIVEDDDIVCAAELNTCRNESNIAAAPKIKIKNFSQLLSNNSLPVSSPPIQSNVVAASGIRVQNVSELLPNNYVPTSTNRIMISLLPNKRNAPQSGSMVMTTTAAITPGSTTITETAIGATPIAATTIAASTTAGSTTTASTPFSPKRFRHIVPKILPTSPNQFGPKIVSISPNQVAPKTVSISPNWVAPNMVSISPNQVHQIRSLPQMPVTILNGRQQKSCIQSTPQIHHIDQILTANTNENSCLRQASQTHSNTIQVTQENLKKILNQQASTLQQALTSPQQSPILNQQTTTFYQQAANLNQQSSTLHQQPTNAQYLPRTPSLNTSNDSNCAQLPKNLTIHRFPPGTRIPTITWMPPQQPK